MQWWLQSLQCCRGETQSFQLESEQTINVTAHPRRVMHIKNQVLFFIFKLILFSLKLRQQGLKCNRTLRIQGIVQEIHQWSQ